MQIGLFEKFRSLGLYVNNSDFFSFSSVPYVTGPGFCGFADIYGTNSSGIFDGNRHTAWASYDYQSGPRYFIVEFKNKPLFINGYKLATLGGPPDAILIEGSNDGNSWFEVDRRNTYVKECSSKKYRFNLPSKVRYLNFSMPNPGRFHIGGIELYGAFNQIMTCKNNIRKSFNIEICLMLILFRK